MCVCMCDELVTVSIYEIHSDGIGWPFAVIEESYCLTYCAMGLNPKLYGCEAHFFNYSYAGTIIMLF